MYEELSLEIIKHLYTPKTLDDLMKIFPNYSREHLRSKLTSMRKQSTVVKLGKKFELSPAFKKGNPQR